MPCDVLRRISAKGRLRSWWRSRGARFQLRPEISRESRERCPTESRPRVNRCSNSLRRQTNENGARALRCRRQTIPARRGFALRNLFERNFLRDGRGDPAVSQTRVLLLARQPKSQLTQKATSKLMQRCGVNGNTRLRHLSRRGGSFSASNSRERHITSWIASADLFRNASRGRPVIAVIDRINSTHWFLAGLLFDDPAVAGPPARAFMCEREFIQTIPGMHSHC